MWAVNLAIHAVCAFRWHIFLRNVNLNSALEEIDPNVLLLSYNIHGDTSLTSANALCCRYSDTGNADTPHTHTLILRLHFSKNHVPIKFMSKTMHVNRNRFSSITFPLTLLSTWCLCVYLCVIFARGHWTREYNGCDFRTAYKINANQKQILNFFLLLFQTQVPKQQQHHHHRHSLTTRKVHRTRSSGATHHIWDDPMIEVILFCLPTPRRFCFNQYYLIRFSFHLFALSFPIEYSSHYCMCVGLYVFRTEWINWCGMWECKHVFERQIECRTFENSHASKKKPASDFSDVKFICAPLKHPHISPCHIPVYTFIEYITLSDHLFSLSPVKS